MKKQKELKQEIKELSQTSEEEKQEELIASIERLQNNGIYRAELLYQLVLINQNLAKLSGIELPKAVEVKAVIDEEEEDEEDEEEDEEE